MTAYVFEKGELVCVVRDTRVVSIDEVRWCQDGIVTLVDETQWYAASGLPVAGTGRRRLTPLLPTIVAQIRRVGRILRIVELATIVSEQARNKMRVSDSAMDRAEGGLREILRARAASMRDADLRDRFWKRVETRLNEAELGAVDQLMYDLEG